MNDFVFQNSGQINNYVMAILPSAQTIEQMNVNVNTNDNPS